jgi:CheY-like chemotaxis protein
MAQINSKNQITYSLGNFNILLADDYDFMQQLITGMLKAFGVGNLMTCNSGADAREILTISMAAQGKNNVKPIDILLTDWLMPEGSGESLVRWIRNHKRDPIRFMPVIVVSAFIDGDVLKRARDSGANEILVKPLSGENLASRILTVIDRPRPFIKTATYFGPDRRRQNRPIKFEDRRKTKAEEIKLKNEQF